MPKDYVNFRLTGERATDLTSASLSFIVNPTTNQWSPVMLEYLDIDPAKLPPIRLSGDQLGRVTATAARETGLPEGLPVLAGGGDYPVALLGSGASRPGVGSDVTGTSSILTQMSKRPILHSRDLQHHRHAKGCGATSCCWRRAATRCAGRVGPFTITR